MKTNTPPSLNQRIFSPNQTKWVDITDHGEIAMGASKLEFTTSFSIDGTSTFIFTNGECVFTDDNTFILWNSKAVLIHYLKEQESFHLTCDELDPPCLFFSLKDLDSSVPKLEIHRDGESPEVVDFKSSLQLFKPGRGFL